MKINLLILICTFFCTNKILSQEESETMTYNKIQVSDSLYIEKKTKKKDFYKTIITVKNTSKNDLYYKVKLHKNEKRKWDVSVVPENNAFAKVSVKNAVGLFKKGKFLIGYKTAYLTESNGLLMSFKKGVTYTYTFKFKVNTGIIPKIINTRFRDLKTLGEFDLKINSNLIDGQYSSNCDVIKFDLTLKKSKEHGNYIEQTIDGKKHIWTNKMGRIFVKLDNSSLWLTYNKKKQVFKFSTLNGINCIWTKD